MEADSKSPIIKPGSREEWILVTVLTAVQVSHTLDFTIIMPLGPQFMRVFSIDPTQFGWMVSAYTFSAAVFGFIGAFFMDRFDRKRSLVTLYAGFAIGTALCAMAPSYPFLLAARVVAGAFGGTMSAVTFAIIGDVFSENRRGTATGAVMSAFSIASVLGVPFGLYLANTWSWHAPFYLLAVLSALVLVLASSALPPMRMHLEARAASGRAMESPWRTVGALFTRANYLRAYLIMVVLMMAGFSVIPYISPYLVANVGLPENDLLYVYLVGGSINFFSARFIGRLSDRLGKLRLFTVMGLVSMVPIILQTQMGPMPMAAILSVTTLFMLCMSGRFVPAMAMITSSVSPEQRGSFMSVNSSIQQMGAGLAALVGGWIVTKSASGAIEHFDRVGYLACASTLLAVWLARGLRREG